MVAKMREKVTGDKHLSIRSWGKKKAREKLETAKQKTQKRIRKAVTGDPTKTIKDYFHEAPSITWVHKLTFTGSVLTCFFTQFIMIQFPQFASAIWVVCIPGLLFLRYYVYSMHRWQYFMLDFCYFTNYSLATGIVIQRLLPLHTRALTQLIWRCVFVWANGPVAVAIIGWRNSLVFHSLDKTTTFAIHVLPMIISVCERWHRPGSFCDDPQAPGQDPPDPNACALSVADWLLWPTVGYAMWQALYLIQTEFVDRGKLEQDHSLLTSLRWLALNTTGSMHKLTRATAEKLYILAPGEFIDYRHAKVKALFVAAQFIYTVVFLPHVVPLYSSFYLHVVFLVAMGTVAVWNGACFYFSVFSKKYEKSIQEGRMTLYAIAKAPPSPKKYTISSGSNSTTALNEGADETTGATPMKT